MDPHVPNAANGLRICEKTGGALDRIKTPHTIVYLGDALPASP
jgi:hypothetical protein